MSNSHTVWTRLSLQRRQRYSFTGRGDSPTDRVEYSIRIPGFYGELRKSMNHKELQEFVGSNNNATYNAVLDAAAKNGHKGFVNQGFSQGGLADVMSGLLRKSRGRRKEEEDQE